MFGAKSLGKNEGKEQVRGREGRWEGGDGREKSGGKGMEEERGERVEEGRKGGRKVLRKLSY